MKLNKSRHHSRSASPVRKEKKSKHKHHRHKTDRKRDKSSTELVHKRDSEYIQSYDATGHKYSNGHKTDICGYTNDINPFMDPNLTEQFTWKKNKRQKIMDCRSKEQELEKVQKRMKEHERQREERQQEQEIIQRLKESQNYSNRKTDSSFDLDQAIVRSKIRIKSDRAQPIDYLIQYINEASGCTNDTDAIMNDPIEYLSMLNGEQLEDLQVDIDYYSKGNAELSSGADKQYWKDFKTVVKDQLRKLSNCNEGFSKESIEDMREMVMLGPIEDAIVLYNDARQLLETGDPKHIDIAYYEYFCNFANVLIAKRRLQENHMRNLQIQLKKLKKEQGVDSGNIKNDCSLHEETKQDNTRTKKPKDEREEYIYNLYEPMLISEGDLGEEACDYVIYGADDDEKKLMAMRKQFISFGYHHLSNKENELLSLAQRGDEKDDVDFSDQVCVEDNSFLWSDKYRPRKPRFLNRVNTGFDWNKYNQTHYDIDNPPPKIVQGYKFNILYPDLIDKTKTPTFDLSVCRDNDQEAIINFRAGPPYQDIAFKIVNKEWETSERFGYKCQFYCNMLQVHFHFKRYRYRK